MDSSQFIFGIHPVIEAIESGRSIDKLMMRKDLTGEQAHRLVEIARPHGIPMQRVPAERLGRYTRGNHQGVVAIMAAADYHRLGDVVPALFEQGVLPFIIVLDGITDVRNFGAIARTAECCGVNAIVIPERGSVGVGADAVKTSAGALLNIPVCRERSLAAGVQYLKKSGFKIVCATEKSAENYTTADYTVPVAIVMGAEDIGISNQILDIADVRAAIPMFGRTGSLNVSVAAGVMMYEVVRQRLLADLEVE